MMFVNLQSVLQITDLKHMIIQFLTPPITHILRTAHHMKRGDLLLLVEDTQQQHYRYRFYIKNMYKRDRPFVFSTNITCNINKYQNNARYRNIFVPRFVKPILKQPKNLQLFLNTFSHIYIYSTDPEHP